MLTDGWIFLAIASAITLGVFLNGLRFARMTRNPFAGQKLFGLPVQGSELPIGRIRLIGRIQMIGAPLIWLLFAAACFGLLGPVQGIETIRLS